MKQRRVTSPANEWLDALVGGSAAFRAKVEQELASINVSQDLAVLRRARGLSQAQLAGHLRVTQSAIAQLESGHARNVGLRTLVRTALALGGRVDIAIRPL